MGRGLLLVLACSACWSKNPYPCATSDQCARGDQHGVCEPEGFCSFADSDCSGGRRFEASAGGGLAGQCVTVDAPVPPCGATGQACCAASETGPACGENLFCNAGTCNQCVVGVAPGRHANCVLRYDHTVWCAGENDNGELGIGQIGPPVATWKQVHEMTGPVITDATAIGGGWEFTCAARTGGALWCWGAIVGKSPAAVAVTTTTGDPLANIVEVGGGFSHACARAVDGGVWCWGGGPNGELGDGTFSATFRGQAAPVLDVGGAAMTGAVSLGVGGNHACVRKADDSLWCWGRNIVGELGDTTTKNKSNPVMVGTGKSVTAGRAQTCSVHLDGTVWCSGESWRNRIGNGIPYENAVSTIYATPVSVVTAPGGPALTGAASVAAGGAACALLDDKTARCWGDDPYGETGTGAGGSVPAPVLGVDGHPLADIVELDARFTHTCAIRGNGAVECWGRNLEGELGDGSFTNRGFAAPVGLACP